MLTHKELFYFCLTIVILRIFPLIKLIRISRNALIVNFSIQIIYSLFFLSLIENHGSKGSGLLWMLYWFLSIIIHLTVLNIWTTSEIRKRKKTATNNG